MKKRFATAPCDCKDGFYYTPYITKKGVRKRHPKGGVYKIPCPHCNK